ncbi:hypothetical protein BDY21DRAFT_37657 [Lineolata rhizophorae]|uniref:Uncharacterized protein n=1 Tax=Lineolata rhizophorae TaxID=578093 RepID=A0A6A6P0G5_9PEZI|nr:hypothetical protein BDY21DRAFT_37657 [Lineolata rhizophorae]
MRLDTTELRRNTLITHADHKTREDTPYISFTNSPSSLQELADFRTSRGGDQSIVIVDPHTRIELGLPVLRYREEMEEYKIRPPYTRDYWSNHYL